MASLGYKNLKVWTKLLITNGAMLCLIIAVAIVSFFNAEKLIHGSDAIVHTQNVMLTLDNVHNLLLAADSGARGYVITASREYLQSYRDAVRKVGGEMHELRKLTSDDSLQQARIDRLEVLAIKVISHLRLIVDKRTEHGFEAARDLVQQGIVQNMMFSIAHVTKEIRRAAESELAVRSKAPAIAKKQNLVLTASLVSGGVILMGLLAFLLFISISDPVQQLTVGMHAIKAGNLDYRIGLQSRDEFGQLSQSFDDMADNLKKTKKRLDTVIQDLARSNKELEQFAYVASHDLQEPLRMVASYTQLLERRYNHLVDEKGKQFIYYAVDGANRMQQLISDLLTFSRVGTRGKEFKKTDLNAVCDRALTNLKMTIDEQHADVLYDALPVVFADGGQMTQLFQNLIGNAIKFHNADLPQVRIHAVEKDDEWIISVSDNGIGIDETYKERIFVIFQRLHTKNAYAGTGIGLAICKKIIERHGGTIWFESTLGKGTTFYFTVPKYSAMR